MSKPLWLVATDDNFLPLLNDHFLPSFRAVGLDQRFDLQVHRHTQPFGTYGSDEYRRSYAEEMSRILRILGEHEDELIVWTDCDLRFYRDPWPDIERHVDQYDLVSNVDRYPQFDAEGNHLRRVACTAVQFFRSTDKLRAFYREWLKASINPPAGADAAGWQSAQDAFNYCLRIFAESFNYYSLGPEYWTAGLGPPRLECAWGPGEPIAQPPRDMVLHHSNFTLGLSNKLALFEEVRRRHAAPAVAA